MEALKQAERALRPFYPRPAAQPGVVKALEWNEQGFAHTDTGIFYRVMREPGFWKLEKWQGSSVTNSAHANEAAAQAAAQADYERRILSTLAAPVSQEPVAYRWRWAEDEEWRLSVDRPAVAPFVEPLYASPQPLTEGEPSEAKRLLDTLREESWDLRCFDVPTGGGDADIGWRIVGHWQAEPCERVIAEVYHDDPQAAIRAALLSAKSKGGQADG